MSAIRVDSAGPSDDGAISAMASEAGLKVNPTAERERKQARLFVARDRSEEPLGFVLGWVVANELEILDVCVHSSARRQGLGTSLVQYLLERALTEGVENAFLEVRRRNLAAQKLYEAHGFSQQGVRERYYSDGEDALLFRCCLSAGT